MHGVVHSEFRQYAIGRLGFDGWCDVARGAGLEESGGFSAATTYPDEDLLGLLLAFGRTTHEPLDQVLTDFGRSVLAGLFDTYSAFIDPRWGAADVLENVERVIHRTVRLQDRTATPPHLKVDRREANVVVIQYTSPRRLCAFGKGLIHGLADRYGERAAIDEPSCMHRGDESCLLRVSLAAPPATA